jgi:hypothetical protein
MLASGDPEDQEVIMAGPYSPSVLVSRAQTWVEPGHTLWRGDPVGRVSSVVNKRVVLTNHY